jgi:hypothetical protein
LDTPKKQFFVFLGSLIRLYEKIKNIKIYTRAGEQQFKLDVLLMQPMNVWLNLFLEF